MKPTVPEVQPIVNDLYAATSGVGCCLHIVLDDGNFEDGHVEWCIEHLQEGHVRCRELALLLKQMSKTQRRKLARCARG
jgi:hypothetical protein